MLIKNLIDHCAPTLASIKTANLFSVNTEEAELDTVFDNGKRQLKEKGVAMTVLHRGEKRVLIYVYRPERLEKDLSKAEVAEFMKPLGYYNKSVSEAIEHLRARLGSEGEFPHEIGLFLGYPLGDVVGFIENGGKNSKCGGYWQVYCNEAETKELFDTFNKCRDIYRELFEQGKSVAQLTVAV